MPFNLKLCTQSFNSANKSRVFHDLNLLTLHSTFSTLITLHFAYSMLITLNYFLLSKAFIVCTTLTRHSASIPGLLVCPCFYWPLASRRFWVSVGFCRSGAGNHHGPAVRGRVLRGHRHRPGAQVPEGSRSSVVLESAELHRSHQRSLRSAPVGRHWQAGRNRAAAIVIFIFPSLSCALHPRLFWIASRSLARSSSLELLWFLFFKLSSPSSSFV